MEDDIIVALCIIIIARDYKKNTKKTTKMDSFMDSKKANTWSHALMQELSTEDPKKTALLSLAFSLHVFSLFSKTHMFADDVVIIFSITL